MMLLDIDRLRQDNDARGEGKLAHFGSKAIAGMKLRKTNRFQHALNVDF